jgi:hypothetical protein
MMAWNGGTMFRIAHLIAASHPQISKPRSPFSNELHKKGFISMLSNA